jgi:hypothetical protein
MIQIVRTYDKQSVPIGFRGTKRISKQRLLLNELRRGTQAEDLRFRSSVWKPAKVALKRETGGKCAYCEAPAGGRTNDETEKGGLVAHCDVEHFRPKKLYWWLAHNFENYTYSCQVCNQSFKSDQFPAAVRLSASFAVVSGAADAQLDAFANIMAPDPLDATARTAWEQLILAEDADLVDPLHENPEQLFKYVAEETLGEVSIAPGANSSRANARAASTIQIVGLEREELRHARYDHYRSVLIFKEVLDDAAISNSTRTKVTRELGRLMSRNQPFAGMVRYFVRTVWQLEIDVA